MKNFILLAAAVALVGCKPGPRPGDGNNDYVGGPIPQMAMQLSERYDLPVEASYKLAYHMDNVYRGDFTSLYAMGFSQSDLEVMASGKNPSAATLRTISEELQISLVEAHNLIQKLKADFN